MFSRIVLDPVWGFASSDVCAGPGGSGRAAVAHDGRQGRQRLQEAQPRLRKFAALRASRPANLVQPWGSVPWGPDERPRGVAEQTRRPPRPSTRAGRAAQGIPVGSSGSRWGSRAGAPTGDRVQRQGGFKVKRMTPSGTLFIFDSEPRSITAWNAGNQGSDRGTTPGGVSKGPGDRQPTGRRDVLFAGPNFPRAGHDRRLSTTRRAVPMPGRFKDPKTCRRGTAPSKRAGGGSRGSWSSKLRQAGTPPPRERFDRPPDWASSGRSTDTGRGTDAGGMILAGQPSTPRGALAARRRATLSAHFSARPCWSAIRRGAINAL